MVSSATSQLDLSGHQNSLAQKQEGTSVQQIKMDLLSVKLASHVLFMYHRTLPVFFSFFPPNIFNCLKCTSDVDFGGRTGTGSELDQARGPRFADPALVMLTAIITLIQLTIFPLTYKRSGIFPYS